VIENWFRTGGFTYDMVLLTSYWFHFKSGGLFYYSDLGVNLGFNDLVWKIYLFVLFIIGVCKIFLDEIKKTPSEIELSIYK